MCAAATEKSPARSSLISTTGSPAARPPSKTGPARWCRRRDFFFGDPAVPEAARFADVRLPLLSVGIEDDQWGTPAAVRPVQPSMLRSRSAIGIEPPLPAQ